MKLGNYVPAYRKRGIEAAKEWRAVIVEEQFKTKRERNKAKERTNYQQIIISLQGINHQQKAYAEQQGRENDRRGSRERRRNCLDVGALM
jgi:hypothetical protein